MEIQEIPSVLLGGLPASHAGRLAARDQYVHSIFGSEYIEYPVYERL